jgi:hypothetical protein
VSVDPVGGSVGSSQSWNRYSYVKNSPLMLVDPNGEDDIEFGDQNAEANTGDAIVIKDARGGVHTATYSNLGTGGELMGYENTHNRNANLEAYSDVAKARRPDNTGQEHHLVDLTASHVNGKPNPYSPENGAVLLGVVRADRLVTTDELAKGAKETPMYYADDDMKQCSDFTGELAKNTGYGFIDLKGDRSDTTPFEEAIERQQEKTEDQ